LTDITAISRRTLLGGGIALAPVLLGAATRPGTRPVVEIASGRVRGIHANGALAFKAIPYAADTGGANRFMPPRPVQPWAGIRDAADWGNRCPQPGEADLTAMQWMAWYKALTDRQGEDCCVLNVFTRDLNRAAKRPVMVYIHGGGFRTGGSDTAGIEGRNLARLGDVVVVTVNHRINVLGFTNLRFLGDQFADSANVGMMDLVAALKWVRENIAQFGGDPHCVTIFGQSGGGSKVSTLMGMPSAKGLIHRAINMSGPTVFQQVSLPKMEAIGQLFARNLGIDRSNIAKLREVPAAQLVAAHRTAVTAIGGDDFRPTIDGRSVPFGPFSAEALANHAHVPLMIGTTQTEATLWTARDPRNTGATAEQARTRIARQYGITDGEAAKVMQAYRDADPGRTPGDVLAALASDGIFRTSVLRGAEAKAAASRAPVFVYNFGWKIPLEGGIWGSPHTADIPFAFGNVENARMMTGPGAGPAQVGAMMLATYVSFARNGNPANRYLPAWKPYAGTDGMTMRLKSGPVAVKDFQGVERRTYEALPTQVSYQLLQGPLVRPPA